MGAHCAPSGIPWCPRCSKMVPKVPLHALSAPVQAALLNRGAGLAAGHLAFTHACVFLVPATCDGRLGRLWDSTHYPLGLIKSPSGYQIQVVGAAAALLLCR